jgi:hypothetical protein
MQRQDQWLNERDKDLDIPIRNPFLSPSTLVRPLLTSSPSLSSSRNSLPILSIRGVSCFEDRAAYYPGLKPERRRETD